MRNRKSMIAAAVLLAIGFTGQAWSQDQNERGFGDNNSTRSDDHSGDNRDNTSAALSAGLGNASASNNSTATANWSNSFNSSTVVATTALSGVVTGNAVFGLGNVAVNVGDASGGDGGSGGDAGAISARDGDSASASLAGAGAVANSANDSSARSRSRDRGFGDSTADSSTSGSSSSTSDASATGGASTSSNEGSSGDATADGGYGGYGGAGGANYADAGTFDMSNHMDGSANTAAGIMVVAQNSGASSLIQQGITVQANLTVGQ